MARYRPPPPRRKTPIDTIELRAGPARACIVPAVGGALAAFDWNGEPILRPTSPEAIARGVVRELACYPLLPFSNRIAAATLRWEGDTFALARYLATEPHAIHGNGWQRAWNIVEHDAGHASLELIHDAVGARAYEWPFAFRARQEFALVDSALTLRLDLLNIDQRPFPFGLGWHPYFPRSTDLELGFRAAGVWLTDATRLPTLHAAANAVSSSISTTAS